MYKWEGAFAGIGIFLKELEKQTNLKMEDISNFSPTGEMQTTPIVAIQLIEDANDFFLQLKNAGLLTNNNVDTILSRAKPLKYLGALPQKYRGVFGRAHTDENGNQFCEINPKMNDYSNRGGFTSRERQKMITFHELAHVISKDKENEEAEQAKFADTCKSQFSRSEILTINNKLGFAPKDNDTSTRFNGYINNLTDYAYFAPNLMNEWFAQELAEALLYQSLGKKRPQMKIQTDERAIPGEVYKSNFEDVEWNYGLYQPIALGLGRALRGIGTIENKSDGVISHELLKRYFNDGSTKFMQDVASECIADGFHSLQKWKITDQLI